jgi:DNA modification methylase
MKSLSNEYVDLIIADPPYGIAKKNPLKGSSHGAIKTLDADWDIFNSKDEYLNFSKSWISECKRILKLNGSIFIYGSRQSIFDMKNILDECGYYYLDMITWIKRDAMPNVTCRGYAYSTEFILWYCNSDSGWTFNHKEIKKYNNDKQMRNYWDIQRTMNKQEKTIHPTQKKIELSDIIVEGHSNINDLVYVPFAGSGSEIESCIRNNRNWIATEINKQYINEIILPRINNINKFA